MLSLSWLYVGLLTSTVVTVNDCIVEVQILSPDHVLSYNSYCLYIVVQ